ncbi:response regulator [Clostridium thermarum]|uniref:response regulator n=1 Tax=Clostridium thermarum TaxID=1716543 RepID=UPI00111CED98|nr:response regulator [Clostridium thermarum]
MYSMLVVDDEYLVRVGIRETIEWKEHSIEIVGDADNGRTGLELALKYKPDIIITDVRMPNLDGLEFLKAIKAANLDSIVIILSGYEEFDYVRTALRSGAFAYLLKPIDNNELLETVLDSVKEINKKRSKLQHYSRIERELSSVKQHFVKDLIIGKILGIDKIREKLELYNITISEKDNFALCLNVNSSEYLMKSLTQDKLQALKNSMTDIISNFICCNNFKAVYTDMSDLQWMIILSAPEEKNPLKLIKGSIKEAIDEFEQVTGQTVTVGISNVCNDLSELHTACAEAIKAVGLNMFTDINRILCAGVSENNISSRKINEAIKYITANYNKDISVESVANALYISSSYLMHLFKDNLGKTFNECLTEIRINAAKELLSNPKYKVYEVCDKVGYNDIKYFSQIFKRSTGMTPSEYSKYCNHN